MALFGNHHCMYPSLSSCTQPRILKMLDVLLDLVIGDFNDRGNVGRDRGE